MTNRQILKDSLLKKKMQQILYIPSEQTLDDTGQHSEAYPQEHKTVLPGNKYHCNLYTASKPLHLKLYKFTVMQRTPRIFV